MKRAMTIGKGLESQEAASVAVDSPVLQLVPAQQLDVLNVLPSMICVFNKCGELHHINTAGQRMSGYDQSVLCGEVLTKHMFPDEELESLVHAGPNSHQEEERIVSLRTRDGERKWLSWSCQSAPWDSGNAGMQLGIGVNVTGRQQVEDKLRTSEMLHRITLSQISDAVFLTDDAGNFTYICHNAHIIFGWTQDEVKEMGSIDRLLGEALFDEAELSQMGEIQNIERQIEDKNGTQHILWINVKKVSILGGTRLYSCRDITARKEIELNLEIANARLCAERAALTQKNAALKEVLREIDVEKRRLSQQIKANVDRLILPILGRIETEMKGTRGSYAVLLRDSLLDLTSPFTHDLENDFTCLSPREIEVCNMVKSGLSSKQIAETLHVSPETVRNQRKSIRKKLGIGGTEANLCSYLRSRLQ